MLAAAIAEQLGPKLAPALPPNDYENDPLIKRAQEIFRSESAAVPTGGMCAPVSPQPMPSLETAFGAQDEALNELHSVCSTLESYLDPILEPRPDQSANGIGGDPRASMPPLSLAVSRAMGNAETIQAATRRLTMILGRVQLSRSK